ncbi:MAG TPA: sigma-70 family RNA polymerase sigma factor [Ktedonobacteraceae bacterium]|nr:sigma-70 family RNA polymerase sigma factor [Ktedonobacteraceae bacterium]
MQAQAGTVSVPPSLSDGLLVQQSLAGDREAFEILVHRYHDVLFHLVYSLLRDYHETYDILQDVFLQLYLSLDTIRVEASLKAWLSRVAHNRCIDRLRRKRPGYFSELAATCREDEPPILDALADTSPLPEELVERQEAQRCLYEAIQALPPRYRSVVCLRWMDGMSFFTIGQKLAIPETTAKTHFYRAKRLLCVALSEKNQL